MVSYKSAPSAVEIGLVRSRWEPLGPRFGVKMNPLPAVSTGTSRFGLDRFRVVCMSLDMFGPRFQPDWVSMGPGLSFVSCILLYAHAFYGLVGPNFVPSAELSLGSVLGLSKRPLGNES